MAYWTGLLKARGRRKGQNRFWPVAAGQRQKLAGCSAYVCCVVLCVDERARTPSVCVQQGCITHPLPLFNMVQSLQGSVQWLL